MHVVHALQAGGMELGVVKLVNGLVGSGVHSSICSTKPVRSDIRALLAPDVPLFELRRRNGNDPWLVRELFRLFRRTGPHIVHTHAWGTLLEGLLAARAARVPAVVHGEHGTLQLRAYQRWLQRVAWSLSDRVLSVSSRLADRMTADVRYPRHRISILRNGVDLSRFRPELRAEARLALGLPEDALVVGTVGRLVRVKDQATLLDAVARLHHEGLRVTAMVAGEGPLRGDLRQQAARLGIEPHVRLLGHRPDVERVLAALDVFVLPSVSEGLSNTILEAMASGVPVVATRVGGADELVAEGETGFLVRAGDPDRLVQALGGLLRDGAKRASMGRAARARAESEFSLPVALARYRQLYEELASTPRHGGGRGTADKADVDADRC